MELYPIHICPPFPFPQLTSMAHHQGEVVGLGGFSRSLDSNRRAPPPRGAQMSDMPSLPRNHPHACHSVE